MDWKSEWKKLAVIAGVFLTIFYMPVGKERFDNAVMEALYLAKWYAQEHVLLCLIPTFFIAGAIAVFVSQSSVMKYLDAEAATRLPADSQYSQAVHEEQVAIANLRLAAGTPF